MVISVLMSKPVMDQERLISTLRADQIFKPSGFAPRRHRLGKVEFSPDEDES
jgi:hypothetical protein